MRDHIMKQLAVVFDDAESRSAKPHGINKRYPDRTVNQLYVFREGYFVHIRHPPREANTSKENDEQTAQFKLHVRIIGP